MPQSTPASPEFLPPVHATTIANFESKKPYSNLDLFKHVHEHDPNVAEYIRSRALELYPDSVDQRELVTQVALEVAAILGRSLQAEQARINEIARLEELLSAPPYGVPPERFAA